MMAGVEDGPVRPANPAAPLSAMPVWDRETKVESPKGRKQRPYLGKRQRFAGPSSGLGPGSPTSPTTGTGTGTTSPASPSSEAEQDPSAPAAPDAPEAVVVQGYAPLGAGSTRGRRSVVLQSDSGLGLKFAGCRIRNGNHGLRGVFIAGVIPGSAADYSGWLFPGDQLLSVNEMDLRTATHDEAVGQIEGLLGQRIELVVACNPAGFRRFQEQCGELQGVVPKTAAELEEILPVSVPGDEADLGDALEGDGLVSTTGGAGRDAATQPVLTMPAPQPHDAVSHSARLCSAPDNEEIHTRLGKAMMRLRDFEKAEEHFLTALHTVVDDSLIENILTALHVQDPSEAQLRCNEATQQLEEQKSGVYYLLGLALCYQGKIVEAQLPFQKCVQQCLPWFYYPGLRCDADDAQFHHRVANALVTQGKFEAALTAYEQALVLKPNCAKWQREFAALKRSLKCEVEGLARDGDEDEDGDEDGVRGGIFSGFAASQF